MTSENFVNNINQSYKLGNATKHAFRGDTTAEENILDKMQIPNMILTTDKDISNLELWTIEGKFIQNISYQKGAEVNLIDIEKGIYVIKATNKKGELFISKLIKQ